MAEGHQSVRRQDTEALLLPVVSSIISKEAWEDLQIRREYEFARECPVSVELTSEKMLLPPGD